MQITYSQDQNGNLIATSTQSSSINITELIQEYNQRQKDLNETSTQLTAIGTQVPALAAQITAAIPSITFTSQSVPA